MRQSSSIDAILELRADLEFRLRSNKYYTALKKIDEILDLIDDSENSNVGLAVSPAVDQPKPTEAPFPIEDDINSENETAASAGRKLADGGELWPSIRPRIDPSERSGSIS